MLRRNIGSDTCARQTLDRAFGKYWGTGPAYQSEAAASPASFPSPMALSNPLPEA